MGAEGSQDTNFSAQKVNKNYSSLTMKLLLKLRSVRRKVHTLYHDLQNTGDTVQC